MSCVGRRLTRWAPPVVLSARSARRQTIVKALPPLRSWSNRQSLAWLHRRASPPNAGPHAVLPGCRREWAGWRCCDRARCAWRVSPARAADPSIDKVFLVTANRNDLPPVGLSALGVAIRSPGAFIDALHAAAPARVETALGNTIADLKDPPYTAAELLGALALHGAVATVKALSKAWGAMPEKKRRRPRQRHGRLLPSQPEVTRKSTPSPCLETPGTKTPCTPQSPAR
jgi:hypothetical protein